MGAKGSSIVGSLFARIFLTISYALCLLTFILGAVIMLLPNYVGKEFKIVPGGNPSDQIHNFLSSGINYGYWHFDGANLSSKPTELSPAGIATIVLWIVALILSIVTVVCVKKAKYTIGKNNKVTKVFFPIHFAILFVVIIGLISQPNLIGIKLGSHDVQVSGYDHSFSLISKYPPGCEVLAKIDTSNIKDLTSSSSNATLNFKNYTVAGYVFFAITLVFALGILVDIIMFIIRIFFNRTRDKDSTNA